MSDRVDEKKEEKSKDKEDIEMEEREKMLNAENKAQEKTGATEEQTGDDKKTMDIKEGMEVKPKKIPIGGIQMPGFFTRSKSKERCKEEGDKSEIEGNELIDSKENKEEQTSTLPSKIKLPNPFRKSKTQDDEEEKTPETKERKKLLDTIRLPLVSVFPRKKKQEQSLEHQSTQAGLASMETLDDKSTDGKSNNELKNVALDDKKDIERQELETETSWKQKFITYRIAIGAFLLFLLLFIIIICAAIPGSGQNSAMPVKDGKYIEAITGCGKVEGLVEDSAYAFRGIPYALPPVGERRFKYAQPLNNISYCWNGTFLAHNATEPCLQILSNNSIIGVEDCLTLDVVTPYVRYDNPLPVIVLIGAGSFIGDSPGKMRPSARYARSKDVVFVRPNFRLGALGFLALEALSQSDYPHISGNYGLSDILEALLWVQMNIAHFGGDPKSVTLFGHRAGATLVTALATIPQANKYFTRAWASSGGAIYPNKTLEEAQRDNKKFMDILDCHDVGCLRSVDAEVLVNAIEDTWRKPQPDLPLKDEEPGKGHQWLVLDGKILKEHPATIWSEQKDLPVNLIIGTTAQASSSEKLLLKYVNWTEALVIQHVRDSFLSTKNLTEEVLSKYPNTYKGLVTMISDIRTVCPLYAISMQMHKVPFYVVTQTRGEQDLADVDSDIDAILGRYEPKTTEQRRYFSAMQFQFYHYVWHGKFENVDMVGKEVLIVEQDVLSNATYTNCALWINKNIVLPYAALD